MNQHTLVIIPTYNERENVEIIAGRIRATIPEAQLLFIDDNSPDGTGAILDHLASKDQKIAVTHRPRKLGVGSAHLDGLAYAYKIGISIVITLDADLTHSPEDIHGMIKALESADVATASRFHRDGGLDGWNFKRKAMTHAGHILTRVLLGLPSDASSAFRAYRLTTIPQGCFDLVRTSGYSFFYESLKILSMNEISIIDVPVVLPARTYGHSKMKPKDIRQSVLFLLRLSLETKFRRQCFIIERQ